MHVGILILIYEHMSWIGMSEKIVRQATLCFEMNGRVFLTEWFYNAHYAFRFYPMVRTEDNGIVLSLALVDKFMWKLEQGRHI